VYKVQDVELEEVVALKTLTTHLLDDPRAGLLFRREVKLARRVTSENIVRIYDLGTHEDTLYITMEFVEGENLRDVLRRELRLDESRCIEILRCICNGLVAAHRVDVVHRDLKPENIMMASDGRVLIADFGIATLATQRVEGREEFVGTPHYVAPEQAQGMAVDGRADLYALGVMAYELLSGTVPFKGPTTMAIIMKRLVEEPPQLPQDVKVSESMAELVARLMKRAPEDRLSSAAELLSALDRLGAKEASTPTKRLRRSNISVSPTSFVGRGDDLEVLRQKFIDGARLVSLQGHGGVGKTRLSKSFGMVSEAEFDAVYFVDLSEATNAQGILSTIARVLEMPVPREEAIDQVGRVLADLGDVLIILDNLEQILQPAQDAIFRWMQLAPLARFLCTTRIRLGVPGEEVVPLGPLGADMARELFVDRVRQLNPHFTVSAEDETVIAQIVERLDRLPLAIELAAARLRLMSPQALLERLESQTLELKSATTGHERRHSTMSQVLEGSWVLLSDASQRALARLSVFEGGMSLDAACAVLKGATPGQPEDLLEELWDHSMLQWEGPQRLGLLRLVKQFAFEKLSEDPIVLADAQRRHAEYFVGAPVSSNGRLNVEEFQNFLESTRNACELEDAGLASSLIERVWRFLMARGPFQTAVELADDVLAIPSIGVRESLHARHVRADGLWRLGDNENSLREAEMALEEARLNQVHSLMTRLLCVRGVCLWRAGALEAAKSSYLEAIESGSSADEFLGLSMNNLGLVYWNLGDRSNAKSYIEDAYKFQKSRGDRFFEAICLGNLGMLMMEEGEHLKALEIYREAIALHHEVCDWRSEALVTFNLGNLQQMMKDSELAKNSYGKALELFRKIGDRPMEGMVRKGLGFILLREKSYEPAKQELELALQIARAVQDRRAEGQALSLLGELLVVTGEVAEGEQAFLMSEQIFRDMENPHDLFKTLNFRARAHAEAKLSSALKPWETLQKLHVELGIDPESELGSIYNATQVAISDLTRQE